MVKRNVEDILEESFKNIKMSNGKIKLKLGINWENVALFRLDELVSYYFSRYAQIIKYLGLHLGEIKMHSIPG